MNRLIDWFKSVYFNNDELTEEEYNHSRRLFIPEGMVSSTLTTLSGGAFLAGFAQFMGIDKGTSGLLINISSFSAVFQLFSPFVFERMTHRKWLIATLAPLHRLMLALIVFVPLIFSDISARIAAVFILYSISYSLLQFTNPPAINWIMSLVPEHRRGRYYGTRDAMILSLTTVSSLGMGFVLDYFRGVGNEFGGFAILYSVVGLLVVANFVLLAKVKEPKVERRCVKDAETGEPIPVNINFKQMFVAPLLTKGFSKVLLLTVFWNLSINIALPYFAIYQVSVLGLDYSFIMFCSVLQYAMMVVFAKIWGPLSDRKGWIFTCKTAMVIMALGHFMWQFVTKDCAMWAVPLQFLVGGITWSGINMSFFNIPYIYSPSKSKTVYLSLNAVVGGVCALIATLCAAFFVNNVGDYSLNLGFVQLGSLQLIFGVSGLLIMALSVFVHFTFRTKKSV